MALLLEVLQNLFMGFPPIGKLAHRYHKTGLNADRVRAKHVLELYERFQQVNGKDILEIGPGQTLEVLEEALASGARSCTAVDVAAYYSAEQAARRQITYQVYDGAQLPCASQQFDLIWSYTAFEHLRYPSLTIAECFRVLRPGGLLVSLIDLGDHSIYGKPVTQPERLFDCLQYPEWLWNLMKWNRSSYTNRLRKSDWVRLVTEAGFVIEHQESTVSHVIAEALPTLPYLHRYSYDDAVTNVVTLWLKKPEI